jgi:hypothetical protein
MLFLEALLLILHSMKSKKSFRKSRATASKNGCRNTTVVETSSID